MDVTMMQHPVGQGGLFSGQIQIGNAKARWVYDCGSNQTDRLGLEVMEVANGGHVDLLFLSHLDSDHVNGVDRLLALTTVGEVVLPYLSALEYAGTVGRDIATGTLSFTFLEFLADPAKWLISRGVGTVSYVQSVDPDKPGPDERVTEQEGERSEAFSDQDLRVAWPSSAVNKRAAKKGTVQDISIGGVLSVFTRAGQVNWVLAPFAHKAPKSHTKSFTNAIEEVFGKGLTRSAIAGYARTADGRKKLRECYRHFWEDHNLVSMSLYAGPRATPVISTMEMPFNLWKRPSPTLPSEIGWLATGDALLERKGRFRAWSDFYSSYVERVGVLVLPHHGSWHSYNPLLAHIFPNLYACLAAAGPNQYGHPDSRTYQHMVRMRCLVKWHHVSEHPDSGFGYRANI